MFLLSQEDNESCPNQRLDKTLINKFKPNFVNLVHKGQNIVSKYNIYLYKEIAPAN